MKKLHKAFLALLAIELIILGVLMAQPERGSFGCPPYDDEKISLLSPLPTEFHSPDVVLTCGLKPTKHPNRWLYLATDVFLGTLLIYSAFLAMPRFKRFIHSETTE